MFADRAAQMAWGLRQRVQNTRRLANGEDIDPSICLFFHPNLPARYLDELTKPRWDQTTGKVKVRKRTKGEASPDRYDATALSFSPDSEFGLTGGTDPLDDWLQHRNAMRPDKEREMSWTCLLYTSPSPRD